jgi:polyphosphate kinase 2 (PPK2 family)
MSKADKLSRAFRVADGRHFRLKDIDPGDTGSLTSREQAEKWLQRGVERMRELENKLYAQDRYAVLLIFQAMDAAGKDGRSST